ncbi:hypothetical protein Val02_19530 [Virgisporangium aliadipatigenens]|uniref:Toxin n=1 Tax=Virgisporangium aliadipatigenens TaxID=741659 RepID=A0A8J3YIS6_9ACTN|nr:hypothetical protein [Virgisporangium aliadipatigenens]GIJ45067.1 hypothetical protein Val02_19530 [Virgisporangium aliadipatigenens]
MTERRVLKELRRSCEARLKDLDVPAAGGVAELCARVAEGRGRPIHLIPMAMPATHPCGFWVATHEADFILYEADTSRTHQEHIVAHELAHLICCHRGTVTLDEASARILFPDVDPQVVRDMLGRAAYTDDQEREAEVMASVLLERLSRPEPPPSEAEGALARITSSLTYRRSG